ncbi:MAG: hypothetical protein LBC53_00005, partial [Spirochaetaceae bacterium]|nr:hypothetical protein [Spirochaetaceae bacterium]
EYYIGVVRQPGWLSPKSCKMLRILRFLSGCCSETEVSEQLYYDKLFDIFYRIFPDDLNNPQGF